MKACRTLLAVAILALAGCGEEPTSSHANEQAVTVAGEAATAPSAVAREAFPWSPATAHMSVNPLETETDDVMTYRFDRGGTVYLLVWTHPRTYYVELYQASGGKWASAYEGATMGKPLLRQTNDHLQLFLVQPFFQIGKEEPRAGHDYYEVVTVDSDGVTSETVELRTQKD